MVVTVGFLSLAFPRERTRAAPASPPPLRLGTGFAATAAATALMLLLHNPALPVLAVGLAAAAGALASVLVNNLPAATLLSAQRPPHPLPLLIGLNLGPNLLFTGSLSTYLWYHAARGAGVVPSLKQSFRLGLVLVPLTMAAALGVLALTAPGAL